MSANLKDFIEADRKSVASNLPVGAWVRYPKYRIWHHEAAGDYVDPVEGRTNPKNAARLMELFAYLQAEHIPPEKLLLDPEGSGVEFYAPLKTAGLFLEFASLFGEDRVYGKDAPPVVQDWVERYGVLGRHATYPTEDGGMASGRLYDREDVIQFVRLAVEAGRCLRLFSAVRNPAGLDVETLQGMSVGEPGTPAGRLRDRAESEVSDIVSKHLQSETCERLYLRKDGTYLKGPGFHSLLGAMYLQMANLMCASDKDIKFCGWCGKVINFEEGEPPPADAPKGTRREKHKTHRNRDFCKETHGIKDWCKNKYNADRRRRAKQRAKASGDTNLTPI
jgi:hypothetical protein